MAIVLLVAIVRQPTTDDDDCSYQSVMIATDYVEDKTKRNLTGSLKQIADIFQQLWIKFKKKGLEYAVVTLNIWINSLN